MTDPTQGTRVPDRGDHHVVVIGAGAGGLALAMLLQRAGIDDVVLYERADGVGGTWRVNTYPGAECDVPSHLYSFSFALNPHWTKTFASQPEILAYLERCAAETGVADRVRSTTAVESVVWDDPRRRWRVRTDRGDDVTAQIVVSAVGMFNRPAWPAIAGLDDFAGPVVHSARWDPTVELAGRRVAVIGTGASAIQIVPAIADDVAHLDVFQRSPAWIMPRSDTRYDAEQQATFASHPLEARRHRHQIYRFYEKGTIFRLDDPRLEVMEAYARSHLEQSVADPVLRRKLTPDYPVGCKRILLSSDFYPTLQREHVELVTEPIDRIKSDGIRTADGVDHPLDVIVLATGFRATDYLAGLDVVGRDGRSLHEVWGDEPRAHLGMTVPSFPNFFVLYGPNTNQGGNSILIILEAQARYVVRLLEAMADRGAEVVDVKPEAMAASNRALDEALAGTVWSAGCGNYFRTPSGHIATQLPHPSHWYVVRTRHVDLGDFELTPVA